ncbi:uncharacterized protein BDR25DRAFT_362822 [Lindgomyces ingoldianus]|uniref:Uncharacterized protein n=1 Tax=Lindgomyces ingoldianus TaxID=673940 RepID=A0ACB6Q992_9PLEO|nr:uncharacterized protein BDR25DRAFT_362822 [Lindgomyces ingoldianus]KAF2463472.1 hypothetical protein BDR25DRAFT_362822 [Lindgomyces ingoldianus]
MTRLSLTACFMLHTISRNCLPMTWRFAYSDRFLTIFVHCLFSWFDYLLSPILLALWVSVTATSSSPTKYVSSKERYTDFCANVFFQRIIQRSIMLFCLIMLAEYEKIVTVLLCWLLCTGFSLGRSVGDKMVDVCVHYLTAGPLPNLFFPLIFLSCINIIPSSDICACLDTYVLSPRDASDLSCRGVPPDQAESHFTGWKIPDTCTCTSELSKALAERLPLHACGRTGRGQAVIRVNLHCFYSFIRPAIISS